MPQERMACPAETVPLVSGVGRDNPVSLAKRATAVKTESKDPLAGTAHKEKRVREELLANAVYEGFPETLEPQDYGGRQVPLGHKEKRDLSGPKGQVANRVKRGRLAPLEPRESLVNVVAQGRRDRMGSLVFLARLGPLVRRETKGARVTQDLPGGWVQWARVESEGSRVNRAKSGRQAFQERRATRVQTVPQGRLAKRGHLEKMASLGHLVKPDGTAPLGSWGCLEFPGRKARGEREGHRANQGRREKRAQQAALVRTGRKETEGSRAPKVTPVKAGSRVHQAQQDQEARRDRWALKGKGVRRGYQASPGRLE